MSEYIEREAALEVVREKLRISEALPDSIAKTAALLTLKSTQDSLESIPAADVVSRGAYDQTDWERCVALTQLKEIGKGLGERMDDVRPVVRGRWKLNKDGSGTCSECGRTQKNCWDLDNWDNFCHFCGADMRGEQNV